MNPPARSNQTHVQHLAADYVLNLLPADQRRKVEAHSQECETCREAIASDRRLAAGVRLALHNAGRPEAGRLQQLMPRPNATTNASFPGRLLGMQRSTVLALCLLVMMISLGSMLLGEYGTQRSMTPNYIATQLAATATGPAVTATVVPSPTSTQSAGAEFPSLMDALHHYSSPAAPRPIGTPVASASKSQSPANLP